MILSLITNTAAHLEHAVSEQPPAPDKPREPGPEAPSAPVIVAQQLFNGTREVMIEHEGVRYRLRITRRNKLILQK